MSELLEKILSKDNMNTAYKRVCANKGAGGVDEVTTEELGDYIKENWDSIRNQIRRREYKTAAGQESGNPQIEWRGEKAGNPNSNGQGDPAGHRTGAKPMCELYFQSGVMVSDRTEAVKWQSDN